MYENISTIHNSLPKLTKVKRKTNDQFGERNKNQKDNKSIIITQSPNQTTQKKLTDFSKPKVSVKLQLNQEEIDNANYMDVKTNKVNVKLRDKKFADIEICKYK